MKHPKWLLILILALIGINLIFYISWYAFDGQGKVKNALEKQLSEALKGTFTIGKLSMNESHITINNISFRDGDGKINVMVRQVQVRYSLIRIFTSGFKFNNVIKQITVYEPDAYIVYEIKPSSESKKKANKLPDLKEYFDNLAISNGRLFISLTALTGSTSADTISFSDKFKDIKVSVTNKSATDIQLTATSANNGGISAGALLSKGNLNQLQVGLEHYKPMMVGITGFRKLNTDVSLKGEYLADSDQELPKFSLNASFWNSNAEYDKYRFHLPFVRVSGNQESMQFSIRNSEVNNNLVSAAGYVFNILNNPSVNSNINASRIILSDITPEIVGTASGKFTVQGELASPVATGRIVVPELVTQNQSFHNVDLNLEYAEKKISFTANTFNWKNQLIDATGNFNLESTSLNCNILTQPEYYDDKFNLSAGLNAELDFSHGINAILNVSKLDFYNKDFNLPDLSGSAHLNLGNSADTVKVFEANLKNSKGISVQAQGSLDAPDIKANLIFHNLDIQDYVKYTLKKDIRTVVDGSIEAYVKGKEITGTTFLSLNMTAPDTVKADVNTAFGYNTEEKKGYLNLATDNTVVRNTPVSLYFKSLLESDKLTVTEFSADSILTAKGWIDFSNVFNSGLWMKADSINIAKYWNLFSSGRLSPPLSTNLSLEVDYNRSLAGRISGYVKTDSIHIKSVKPLKAEIVLSGSTTEMDIETAITSGEKILTNLHSKINRTPELKIHVNGIFDKINIQDIFSDNAVSGILNGDIDWKYSKTYKGKPEQSLSANLAASSISYGDLTIDTAFLAARQLNEILHIDSLAINMHDNLRITGKGDLDYNFLTNNYTPGNHVIDLAVKGDPLKVLQRYTRIVESGRSNFDLSVSVAAGEEGIIFKKGSFTLTNGTMRIKTQPESITDIDIEGLINDNVLNLNKFSCEAGPGRLYIRNEVDPSGDNFYAGPLNLGYFLIRTSSNGVQVSIPDYIPSNTVVNAVVKGQQSREATVRGPFDDMKINAEVIASNGSVVYPANTKNILQLINLFQKKQDLSDQIPLPFTMDLLIRTGDNVRYVTYPADLTCSPGSSLRLTYDGNMWAAKEADFISEKGTLDFYGTTFQVEHIKVEINSISNMVNINGTFTKKASDGSLITLSVLTNPQKGNDIFNQLEFKLTSDNPQDKTTTQILSRLRYNRNVDELSPEQRQSLLQDEAMQLISTSVSTTYVSQFLSPIENKIRQFLKLDSFSISTGFVQNLFVEFATNDPQTNVFTNPDNLNSDILQFSSSIFLNNLSVSMGKYMGNSVYVDYEVLLQETTDLAKKTKLDFYHNASLRFTLPWKLKFIYTFSIRPVREGNTHEVMLQRSFRF